MIRTTITYKKKEYPIIAFTNYKGQIDYLAEKSLWDAIKEGYYNNDKECERIDNMIFYYCENNTFEESDEFIKVLINCL